MRRQGSPEALARLRRIGVERLLEGWEPREVADALGVHVSSVGRWAEAYDRDGWAGLAPAVVAGRPPKLTGRQAERVLSWVREHTPQELGFAADAGSHWTARRLASVVQRVARERDDAAIDRWVRHDWPAIKRGRPPQAQRSCFPTNRG